MRFDTKIAIAVREDLATWQKLNVTAFLASAVAGGRPEVIGERYQDGSGHVYLPMFRQPVLVYAADAQALSDAHGRALARELDTALYIEEMFKTGHDADNRAAGPRGRRRGDAAGGAGGVRPEERRGQDLQRLPAASLRAGGPPAVARQRTPRPGRGS
jgi:hypothetical protein